MLTLSPKIFIELLRTQDSQEKKFKKMKRSIILCVLVLVFSLLPTQHSLRTGAKSCKPSGKVRGTKPPPGKCEDNCCASGKLYPKYKCSPKVTSHTKAFLTINNFQKGGDGGGPSECDNKYHSNDIPIVALSTGWFNNLKRCFKNITISGNGRSVVAMVVDECDSTAGCDDEHGYQPPCDNNIVDGSKAVWEALGVPSSDWGWLEVTWTDA